MRCRNCGWTNPDGIVRCQKCNQVLTPTSNGNVCIRCGHPVNPGDDNCPSCGTSIHSFSSGVLDNSNNRATTIAGVGNMGNSDGRATVRSPHSSVSDNLRATVVAPPMGSESNRATVMSAPYDSKNVDNQETQFSQSVSGLFEVRLSCLDDSSHSEIFIHSKQPLALGDNEVILIAGLRYVVI